MATSTTKPSKKQKSSQNPETKFLINLNSCSKSKDLQSAISLYESQHQNLHLNLHHFNSLLYLCSNSASNTDPSTQSLAFGYGFRIFRQMLSKNITPNEATVTAVARLAAAKGDGDYAFEVVKNMGDYGISPRLRTYDPALLCFCKNLEAEKAYEVEEHMGTNGVTLEEMEIAALLRVSAENGRGEKVYGYLHKLRSNVRGVSEETGRIVEDWFRSEKGCGVGGGGGGGVGLVVREVVERNGGGWHGLGWTGEGKWVVRRGSVEESGRCCCCGEHLVCVDIDEVERERFAKSVSGLAMVREVKGNFTEFQDWLEKHAYYEAIVDGANIGLYQQNFAEGGFSVPQLDAVMKELYNKSGNKWPLVVLHNKRLRALLENPSHRELVKDWMDKGVLYTTPHGSNDDWYWLYAAVKLRCLLVTNDEMRDHIFELLGSSFFLKWKERHQVRYTFVKGNLKLQMPPTYSLVIQESEKGSWHVPIAGDSNEEAERTWLCITRPSSCEASEETLVNMETLENGHAPSGNPNLLNSCESGGVMSHNNNNGSQDLFQDSDNKTTTVTGKRKERSSSVEAASVE